MSDVAQGPGWWQASNGRWYAPETLPQEAVNAHAPAEAGPDASAAAAAPDAGAGPDASAAAAAPDAGAGPDASAAAAAPDAGAGPGGGAVGAPTSQGAGQGATPGTGQGAQPPVPPQGEPQPPYQGYSPSWYGQAPGQETRAYAPTPHAPYTPHAAQPDWQAYAPYHGYQENQGYQDYPGYPGYPPQQPQHQSTGWSPSQTLGSLLVLLGVAGLVWGVGAVFNALAANGNAVFPQDEQIGSWITAAGILLVSLTTIAIGLFRHRP